VLVRLALLALLLCSSCVTTPFVVREQLRAPQRIVRIQHDGLTLDSGMKVMPRYVDTLPVANEILHFALRNSPGVEVRDVEMAHGAAKAELTILVDLAITCGNDPLDGYVARVNVSELVAIVDPGALRRDVLSPQEASNVARSFAYAPLDQGDLLRMEDARRAFHANVSAHLIATEERDRARARHTMR
jgi:hypothetical protein